MKKTLLLLSLFGALTVSAQELPYTLTTFNEPFVPIANPISVDNGELWDDPNWIVPIGFDFDLCGQTMSSISIIAPGAQIIPAIVADSVSMIFPYFADLQNASFDSLVSPVNYSLEGNPGNRIFKLEYLNAGFWAEGDAQGTFANVTNFQMWFYETTNDIEVRFGTNSIQQGNLVHIFGQPTIFIGRKVAMDGSGWEAIWSLNGDPANPGVSTITSLNSGLNPEQMLNAEPAEGQVYHFDTGIVGVSEQLSPDQASLKIYPTLASSSITAAWNSSEKTIFTIYDLVGHQVSTNWLIKGNNNIDISELPAGVYLFRAGFGDETHTLRFIKQ